MFYFNVKFAFNFYFITVYYCIFLWLYHLCVTDVGNTIWCD